MKFSTIVKIHRYPGIIAGLWRRRMINSYISRSGIILKGEVGLWGCPIISRSEGTSIIIDEGAILCSESKSTALGVNHPVILRTLRPGAKICIGKNVRMSGTTICAAVCVTIKDNVCIGSNTTIADTDFHSLDPDIRRSKSDAEYASYSPVVINDNVFIGAGCYILKGVEIGDSSVIGANSVVVNSIPPNVIAAGNPAKVIKQRDILQ